MFSKFCRWWLYGRKGRQPKEIQPKWRVNERRARLYLGLD